jgi:hypothetical protein
MDGGAIGKFLPRFVADDEQQGMREGAFGEGGELLGVEGEDVGVVLFGLLVAAVACVEGGVQTSRKE